MEHHCLLLNAYCPLSCGICGGRYVHCLLCWEVDRTNSSLMLYISLSAVVYVEVNVTLFIIARIVPLLSYGICGSRYVHCLLFMHA